MTDWNSREGAVKGQDLRREQVEHQAEQWAENVGLRRFESGQRAVDHESDDDSQVLVLGARGKVAEDCHIEAINQTVAGANPEYPANDPVADVAFVESIETALGIEWSADDVLQLVADGDLERARIKHYAYPESRLAPAEESEL